MVNFKLDKKIVYFLVFFYLISVVTIYSSKALLPTYMDNLYLKQTIWYLIGTGLIILIVKIKNSFIIDNIWILYILFNLLLLSLLFFAPTINDAKCWFQIPGIGNFQPSEFMKIILIVLVSKLLNDFRKSHKNPKVKEEFLFLGKTILVLLIPSILTFLQPDTGVVLIYLITTITILFIGGIRYRYFITGFSFIALIILTILGLYFFNNNLFIEIFGNSFFLRIDRLLNWSNKIGFQLQNGMAAIGSAYLFGHGFNNTPIYFPEPQTDFIFAVYSSNFGFIGSIILFGILFLFDLYLLKLIKKSKDKINKYITSGILGMLLYQQLQNIGMTYGIIPITGITLPFISYGGSSLLSYMMIIGIVLNISSNNSRFKNI